MRRVAAWLLGLMTVASAAQAQTRAEYRAFWVDTFNTALNNHDDVLTVVNNAKAENANAIFAQVRRRGDSWYLNSLEPLPDFVPIAEGFDPLQDLIDEAHANGIEVHAFVIIGAVWNKDPNITPPTDPSHVFNLHGGFDPASGCIEPGPENWLTRTLLPDGSAGVTFQGHRFGNDFWIDLGHPDAAEYTLNVLMHLVRNYDLDGLHLDRIRYPEIGAAGQSPTTGASIGYNAVSLGRYRRHYGLSPSSIPAPGDPKWMQWRRDQVTNFVRRVYLNAIAVKPQLKISAALIAFGGIGSAESAWKSTDAYWRVYQDWRAWTEEGILDIAMPMNYKRENLRSHSAQFDQWNNWMRSHQYNRAALMGVGVFLNGSTGTLRQTRRSLEPTPDGNRNLGVVLFSMATFTGGMSPHFTEKANVPELPWKTNPQVGHLMGFARRGDGSPLDTATVTIENTRTKQKRTTKTDGKGFFGGVDLAPGVYLIKARLGSEVLDPCLVSVDAGVVMQVDLNGPSHHQ